MILKIQRSGLPLMSTLLACVLRKQVANGTLSRHITIKSEWVKTTLYIQHFNKKLQTSDIY